MYTNTYKVECPTGSGNMMNCLEVSLSLSLSLERERERENIYQTIYIYIYMYIDIYSVKTKNIIVNI